MSGHYSSTTLKSFLHEDTDMYLQEATLTSEESNTLTHEFNKDGNEMDCKQQMLVPEYDTVSRKFGFESGNEKIDTHDLEIRCNPSNAIILKKMFTRI